MVVSSGVVVASRPTVNGWVVSPQVVVGSSAVVDSGLDVVIGSAVVVSSSKENKNVQLNV